MTRTPLCLHLFRRGFFASLRREGRGFCLLLFFLLVSLQAYPLGYKLTGTVIGTPKGYDYSTGTSSYNINNREKVPTCLTSPMPYPSTSSRRLHLPGG